MKINPYHLLLLLLLPQYLSGQRNPQPHFRNYSTEQGLPSPEVYIAMQDSRGYMWFGTDNGAARFDGYTFKTYGAREGLSSNVVFDIHEDDRGRIWFGTMTGEAFVLEGDTIKPYQFNNLVDQFRDQFSEAGLVYLQPEEETAYFELLNFGFLKIDSTGKGKLITTDKPLSKLILEIEGLDRGLSTTIERHENMQQTQFWKDYEIKKQVTILESVSPQKVILKELPFNVSTCNSYFTAQRLTNENWLIVRCNQLYYLQNGEIEWIISFDFETNEIVIDKNQAIWFCGKKGRGLRRYADLKALKNGRYDQFLKGLSISNIFFNSDDGLWVTTLEEGVFYCNNMSLLNYDRHFGFTSDLVTAVAFKNNNELFAGCKNGDIFELNLSKNEIIDTLVNLYRFFNHDLFYYPEKHLLLSSFFFWEKGQWNLTKYRDPITRKWKNVVTSKMEKLHLNGNGELVGCNYNGVHIMDLKTNTLRVDPFNFKLKERTFAVHTDKQQRLWVGNARGIFEFRDSSLVTPGIDHPAFHSRVEDIHEFPDGSLVFGTKGWGVIRWQGETILQISTDEGLTSDMIEDVHVDEQGILWVGTLNGLNKITFDTSGQAKVRQFTMANGLPSNEITKVRSYEGQVWLCTPKGLVRFHEQPEDTVSAAPILQDIVVNGDRINPELQPVFSYRENNFSFQFLTINYRQNGNIPYRFRLNKQADWSYTQNLSVNYPQLRWGDYHFEVQSQNEDGYWSPSTIYAFEIRPPWWATSWFILLSTLGILALGFGFYKYRTTQLKRENQIQQQMTALERSALQAQMNPHFIFNCLGSIQNFILQNERKQAVEYLSRFAQLVRHNLNASVQGSVSLEEELSLLDNYLALEQERFEHRFDYSLTVAEEIDKNFISLPPMLIQPYVENAIIHGLSKKQQRGKVEVDFAKENGHLVVKIRDNGPGYQPDLKKKFNGQHKSVGMTITQKRLELLGNNPEKVVQISTLNGEKGRSGTEVRILIDLK